MLRVAKFTWPDESLFYIYALIVLKKILGIDRDFSYIG